MELVQIAGLAAIVPLVIERLAIKHDGRPGRASLAVARAVRPVRHAVVGALMFLSVLAMVVAERPENEMLVLIGAWAGVAALGIMSPVDNPDRSCDLPLRGLTLFAGSLVAGHVVDLLDGPEGFGLFVTAAFIVATAGMPLYYVRSWMPKELDAPLIVALVAAIGGIGASIFAPSNELALRGVAVIAAAGMAEALAVNLRLQRKAGAR